MEDLPAPVRPTMPICTESRRTVVSPAAEPLFLTSEKKTSSHLLSSLDVQCDVLQDEVQTLAVPNAVLVELHVPLYGPVSRGLLVLHLPGGL